MFHYRPQLISAAALLFALALPAQARDVTVSYGDLNLATDSGRVELQQRLAHAADQACGSAHGRTTAEVQAYADCSHAARGANVSQFDAAVAAAQQGKKVATDRNAPAMR